jgi:hypothetical protein
MAFRNESTYKEGFPRTPFDSVSRREFGEFASVQFSVVQ